jgi:MFS family permease
LDCGGRVHHHQYQRFCARRIRKASLKRASVSTAPTIVYALSAYPLGALSDRIHRDLMLEIGFATLIAADIVLAFAPNISG